MQADVARYEDGPVGNCSHDCTVIGAHVARSLQQHGLQRKHYQLQNSERENPQRGRTNQQTQLKTPMQPVSHHCSLATVTRLLVRQKMDAVFWAPHQIIHEHCLVGDAFSV